MTLLQTLKKKILLYATAAVLGAACSSRPAPLHRPESYVPDGQMERADAGFLSQFDGGSDGKSHYDLGHKIADAAIVRDANISDQGYTQRVDAHSADTFSPDAPFIGSLDAAVDGRTTRYDASRADASIAPDVNPDIGVPCTPLEEVCDGIDNDCDREIDELDCNACPLSENTAGYWNFDEESGTIAYDIGENNLDGTLSDATSRGAGVYNRGLSLDGLDDLVRVPYSSSLNVERLTITHWVKKSVEQTARIICRHEDGGPDGGYATQISADGKFTFVVGGYGYSSSSTIPLDEWTHLAVTLSEEGDLKMYINGELDSESILNAPMSGSSLDLVLGRQANNPGANYFQGDLDEVKIYSCVLSEVQVRDDYERD